MSINPDSVRNQAAVYQPMSVSYTVKGAPLNIKTIAINALLVGKVYRSESKNALMSKLAECINKKVPDLADDSKTNPNWGNVYDQMQRNVMINWAYFPVK